MPFVTRKSLLVFGILAGLGIAAAAGFVWSGIYNVAADDVHTRPVYALMETLRERSIETRARTLQVPDLGDPARITQGAGNYNAMCVGCHLAPGMPETEMSKGLYPAPPDLAKETVDVAEAFWVIKHGIKASGMPAWGKSMDDEYIWNMAAFIQQLPRLTPEQYRDMVARSGGHSHGGVGSSSHEHGAGTPDDHHGASAAEPAATGETAAPKSASASKPKREPEPVPTQTPTRRNP